MSIVWLNTGKHFVAQVQESMSHYMQTGELKIELQLGIAWVTGMIDKHDVRACQYGLNEKVRHFLETILAANYSTLLPHLMQFSKLVHETSGYIEGFNYEQ